MHPRVSVNSLCSASWTLGQDLAFYEAHGIDHVALAYAKCEAAGVGKALDAVEHSPVHVDMLFGVMGFELDAPGTWDEPRARFVDLVDTAATLPAASVMVTTGRAGGLTWEDAADAFEAAIAPGLDHAAARDVPVMVEHTNSLRVDIGFVHTLRDMIDLGRRLGVGVLMEVNACWMERGLAATVRRGIDSLALVQVSDFSIGTTDSPNRRVPGDGDIPLERILGTVLDAGYTGRFDLEVLGPYVEEEGYESTILRSVERLSELLDRLSA